MSGVPPVGRTPVDVLRDLLADIGPGWVRVLTAFKKRALVAPKTVLIEDPATYGFLQNLLITSPGNAHYFAAPLREDNLFLAHGLTFRAGFDPPPVQPLETVYLLWRVFGRVFDSESARRALIGVYSSERAVNQAVSVHAAPDFCHEIQVHRVTYEKDRPRPTRFPFSNEIP